MQQAETYAATAVREIASEKPAPAVDQTIGQMVRHSCTVRGGDALRYKDGASWKGISYDRLGEEVTTFARGLVALGVEPGDRVSIIGETRPEWTIADLGALTAGAVVAPIYHTNSPGECRHVLAHSGARVVVCENEEQLAKVREVWADCPRLEHAVLLEGEGEHGLPLAELAQRAESVEHDEIERRLASGSPADVATIIYTSGTTGPPKGCVLTHENVMSTVRQYEQQIDLGPERVIFMFLPLAHALARVVQMVALDVGGTLAFWSRDSSKLLDDVREAEPTHFPSVPRVFEKIHTAAIAGIEQMSPLRRALARWAIATGRRARAAERQGGASPLLRAQVALADRLVLSKLRALFGSRIELALTGAAPIACEVLEFFDACGLLVLEGYGMTESTAAGTLNTVDAFRFGTVGRPLPGTRLRIAEDGELLIAGPNVFAGYYENADATHDTLDGEWLRTGDLAGLDADGFISITGRKKEIIVTSSGKNISPANIENQLRESRWISEAVVFGDRRSYLVALLTLDPDEAPALARELGVPAELASMARDPGVAARIQEEVDRANRHFARIEQVKRFAILERDLSQEHGELTPTLKVKRNVVGERYADEIARMYA